MDDEQEWWVVGKGGWRVREKRVDAKEGGVDGEKEGWVVRTGGWMVREKRVDGKEGRVD